MNAGRKTQILIVGSGAGGATTALELASRGYDVTVLEEGPRPGLDSYGKKPIEAMRTLYRNSGMTPLTGSVPMGFVEGACVGGSTEINSGFWHRTPRETLVHWHQRFDLQYSTPVEMEPHFQWAEAQVGIGHYPRAWPESTKAFQRGADAMGWGIQEVPRTAPGCASTNACAQGCPTGAKQGMSVSLLPRAERAGARIIPDCRVILLLRGKGRVEGVMASVRRPDGRCDVIRILADVVFLCGGATQSPTLLRRSGFRFHVGNTLNVHPMLKVAAVFPYEINAGDSVLPLLQVMQFAPSMTMGGAFFTTGHLALNLSDNWPQNRGLMHRSRQIGTYYVAVKGSGNGMVRPSNFGGRGTRLRYELTNHELKDLSAGLARLSILLLAAGAEQVVPSVQGVASIRSEAEAAHWLHEPLARSRLSLTSVHAFSSCPAGENLNLCAVNSVGKVFQCENLYVNDASIIPDSPGVNPQGSVMALAHRNAVNFAERGGSN